MRSFADISISIMNYLPCGIIRIVAFWSSNPLPTHRILPLYHSNPPICLFTCKNLSQALSFLPNRVIVRRCSNWNLYPMNPWSTNWERICVIAIPLLHPLKLFFMVNHLIYRLSFHSYYILIWHHLFLFVLSFCYFVIWSYVTPQVCWS